MANITLTGTLLDPNSGFAARDKIRFTHKTTTGSTLKGSVSTLVIGADGSYSIDLQYGLVLVERRDSTKSQYINLGVVTVNADNPATTLPELLSATVPVSSEELIEFQSILADCVAAQLAAEAAAADAAQLGTNTGASLVGTSSGATVQESLDALTEGQTGGLIVFATYALLDAYTPQNATEEKSSFKVTNDSNTALNGYYSWVSGTTYTKDADLANGVIEAGNVDAVSGAAVHEFSSSSVLSSIDENSDRLAIVSDFLTEFNSYIYASTGTPKAQSTLYAGYATALTASAFDDFDRVDIHIQLDAPTECRVSILDASLVRILSVNIDGVDGWNSVILPRLIKSHSDGSVLYIGIETVNRDAMTINTMGAIASEYASTSTYPVKGTPFANDLSNFSTTVSSQFRIPFRIWNSHDLYVKSHNIVKYKQGFMAQTLSSSVTESMADYKGGELEGGYLNFLTTVCGFATAYLTPTSSFDVIRTWVRLENDSAVKFYLKTDELGDLETFTTDTLLAGDHYLVLPLTKKYSSVELGTQFYVAVESVGHVSRMTLQNFTDNESNFPQPASSYPVKTTTQAADENTWTGGGSSTSYRLYCEFSKLTNITQALSNAVATAESAAGTVMQIPSQMYAIDGLNNQNIYYTGVTKSADPSEYYYDINAGLTGRLKAKSWQNRKSGAGTAQITASLYSKDRVLLDTTQVTLNNVLSSAGSGLTPKVLCIGDSITARGFYTQDLIDLAAADVMGLDLIGTIGTAPNLHEGVGGKTVDWFYTDAASPFVFNGVFDFPQYMSNNTLSGVDYIFIHLGVNDIYPATSDSGALAITESATTKLESMITSFKSYNASVKIGLMLPITPSFDQDAWGIVYSDSATYWRYNSSRGVWCENIISAFDNRTGEDIYVLPTNLAIDIDASYNVADPIHPIDNGAGYESMANVVWAFMKNKA